MSNSLLHGELWGENLVQWLIGAVVYLLAVALIQRSVGMGNR